MRNFKHGNLRRFLGAAGVALAIPLSAAAFQGHPGGHEGCSEFAGRGGHGMGGEMMPPHLRGLNLTEVQRDKVFEIMHAQAPVMRDKAKAVRKAEEDLRALSAAPDFSEAKARAIADTAAKAMSEMMLARVNAERQVFDVLTPEQRKQLAETKTSGEPGRGRGDGSRGMGGEGRTAQPAR